MVLGSPIVVTIFDEKNPTRKLSTVKLDAPAMSVKGSMINTDKTDFKVNLDWKQQVGTLESFIKKHYVMCIQLTSVVINQTNVKQKNLSYFNPQVPEVFV
jgi:hypothetical protein